MLAEILRPLIRFLVGFIAIPLFRLFVRKLWKEDDLSRELIKDLEQWFRGALLLLLATRNFELLLLMYMAGKTEMPLEDLQSEWGWVSMAMRLLLAIGVIQSMPDQDLFSIIHVGSFKLSLPPKNRIGALRQQAWPLLKSIVCRHLDRSSSVFAILAVVLPPGRTVWICYGLACIQFLIIGLVSSRDKALDVLAQFDTEIHKRRLEIERERQSQREEAERQSAAATLLKKAAPNTPSPSIDSRGDDQPASSG